MTLLTKEQVAAARKAKAEGDKLIVSVALDALTGDAAKALVAKITEVRDAIIDDRSQVYEQLGHVLTVLANVPLFLQQEAARLDPPAPVMVPEILPPA
jgi:hypothetical protein